MALPAKWPARSVKLVLAPRVRGAAGEVAAAIKERLRALPRLLRPRRKGEEDEKEGVGKAAEKPFAVKTRGIDSF